MVDQTHLKFGPIRNSGLFSGHWLEQRLRLEPELREVQDAAEGVLAQLAGLWERQRDRVEKYGDEPGLEHAFIQPVFEALGWSLKYQTFLDRRRPDYALFLSDADLDGALNAGRESPDFWRFPAVVADAKAWHVSLDHRIGGAQKEYPPQQIEWYLDRSRLDFGILTNGRIWRIYPRVREPYQNRFETYFEFDLAGFLTEYAEASEDLYSAESLLDDFLRFYLFFGPAGYLSRLDRLPLVRRAVRGSSDYRLGIGEDVRERAFEALRLCISGFLECTANSLDPDADLERCRDESFVLIYRLLFAMYAEDRGLLPYGVNQTYTNNRSLRRLRDEVAADLDATRAGRQVSYQRNSFRLWESLQDLFDLIDAGHKRYAVPAYNGGLFDQDEHDFLRDKKLPDWHLARVIDRLGRAPDPFLPDTGTFRIDYRDLAIQHLGGIYEGMLELHPRRANVPMTVVAKRRRDRTEERIVPASHIPDGYERIGISYQPGDVYLETNKGERRASGSYYTPDHIVQYIVHGTLGPVCEAIDADLRAEIESLEADGNTVAADALRQAFDDRVLNLRVLDPAMGSGHFLLRACSYLAEEIATNPYTGDPTIPDTDSEESALTYWKRRVAESCLYGVDRNSMAVELAKLALWLETVAADRPLTYMNHRLRTGDSLIGAKLERLGGLPDAPQGMLGRQFRQAIRAKLPALLGPFEEIAALPSELTEQVKQKGRIYRRFERARLPFHAVADVWCSTFTNAGDSTVTADHYHRLLESLGTERAFQSIADEKWIHAAKSAAAEIRPFHWELEFPAVFYRGKTRRDDAGFDAIIGNPPYDVLSEAETGRDLSALRAAIRAEPSFKPSVRGKNNLYKLFVCRALDLLTDGGRLGFITPMAVLGDDQAATLRRELLNSGRFTAVESFPQKDNREKRVFRDAKLSTAVFLYRKGTGDDAPFTLRVHPGRDLDEVSAELTLSTAEVPLYDPENLSIVSCSQADWDLAVRLMKTGRMGRLGEVAQFFQGEVNETIQRRRGTLTTEGKGHYVTRGAGICLYVTRETSQGTDIYLDVPAFLDGASPDSKAYHHRHARVVWQESCPQNNFRRIIAALLPEGEFCNHKVNYAPAHTAKVNLRLLLALLNSKLADWYFRLGSTNAAVSHYQIKNLPFPRFSAEALATNLTDTDSALPPRLVADDVAGVVESLTDELAEPPFGPAIVQMIVAASSRIIEIERDRGDIARRDRSQLAPEAQPYQNLIDRLFYRLAGLTDTEAAGLEDRLSSML